MTQILLEDLIEAVAHQDKAAFTILYAVTSTRVTAIAVRILRHHEDAEEAAQEIYIKVWRQAGGFERSSGTSHEWLGAIARNHAIDVVRRRKLQPLQY